ncbi:hypothetical protein EVAR_93593_1 [Eumeta japonica]|uniref:Uncharacterized protein n=1 Tax=Eumeta variegata TaxID=151549 RepID=A0A4C1TQG7_EUMVA|nr:hypothetical protein EVAR_93593_1 [Eumeta japonica]
MEESGFKDAEEAIAVFEKDVKAAPNSNQHQQINSVNLKPISRCRYDVKITLEREDLPARTLSLRNFDVIASSTECFEVYRIHPLKR